MTDFQSKKRMIIAGLVVLFLADLALFYFNSRLSTPANERQQALTAEARRLALIRADVDHATKVKATIPEILKDFDSFESTLLPASKGYSTISQDLDEYAKESHVVLAGYQAHEKEVAGHPLSEVDFEASIDGDYNGIVTFLNKLQRSKNTYIVDSLAVESSETGHGATGELKVALRLRTYFRKA
jgi:Tfp pilus assembly protein PilO